MSGSITDIPGIAVGHWTDRKAATGCTVVLCEAGAVGGVDVRGSAPGTRETDLLRPMNLVQSVHAILLSGGSAYGLDAAAGVMRYLEEKGIGFETRVARVPIVPAAVLFDLGIGRSDVRPGPRQGYLACQAALAEDVAEGSVGAGTGATVGKALGLARAVKGGIGVASRRVRRGPVVGALVAVNAYGDVVDEATGRIIAGPRKLRGRGYLSTVELLASGPSAEGGPLPANTTLGVVATDARLTKEQANKLAQMAHDGLARAVRPAHTMVDGDVIFALATGGYAGAADVSALGALAAEAVAEAIVRAVRLATPVAGIPAAEKMRQ
ncbi:MAG: P1 family peptidase [Dehalococcoidia bacterium]|nr:P1 family peptidase [Dehalococcoidia bacterium]